MAPHISSDTLFLLHYHNPYLPAACCDDLAGKDMKPMNYWSERDIELLVNGVQYCIM
jgi:hypothetical protein